MDDPLCDQPPSTKPHLMGRRHAENKCDYRRSDRSGDAIAHPQLSLIPCRRSRKAGQSASGRAALHTSGHPGRKRPPCAPLVSSSRSFDATVQIDFQNPVVARVSEVNVAGLSTVEISREVISLSEQNPIPVRDYNLMRTTILDPCLKHSASDPVRTRAKLPGPPGNANEMRRRMPDSISLMVTRFVG